MEAPAPTPTPESPTPAAAALEQPQSTDLKQQPEETKPAEAPVEAKEPEKDDKFSSRFAALAKREKAIQAREAKIKEMETRFSSIDKQDAEFKSNPIKFLQDRYGLSYNDLTQLVLNDNKPTPEMKVRELEEKLTAFERQKQDEAKKAEEERINGVINKFMGEIGSFVDDNANEFELIKAHGEGKELIYNVIDQHLSRTGRMLSIKEAAEHVEKYLTDEAQRFLNLNKFKPKEAPKEAPKAELKAAVTPKTLTNQAQTEVPTPKVEPLSIEESKRRAAALLKWT